MSVLGSCPCSSSKEKDLQAGEWSPFGPKTAGFGTGIGWPMELGRKQVLEMGFGG